MIMKEMTGWVFTGLLGGVALFSLATVHDPAPGTTTLPPAPEAQLALLGGASPAPATARSAALADAYFAIARSDRVEVGSDEDWLIRHQMTLKGFDAEQGLIPAPESPDRRSVAPADEAALKRAYAELTDETDRNRDAKAAPSDEVLTLTAALQAQYDWWLLGCEAGWKAARVDEARHRFNDTLSALANARARSTLAAL